MKGGRATTGRHGNIQRDRSVMLDVHRVRVGNPYVYFRFSEAWGPILTDTWGDPIDNRRLANEDDPFWDQFEEWLSSAKPASNDATRSEASEGMKTS